MSNMNQKLFPLPRGDPKKSKTKYKIWAYSLCALRKKINKNSHKNEQKKVKEQRNQEKLKTTELFVVFLEDN